jgi:YD repeat-containing protein
LVASDKTWSSQKIYNEIYSPSDVRKIIAYKDTTNISYDSSGNITEIDYDGGYKALYTYDAVGNLSKIDYTDTDGTTVLITETYTYDANGNLVSITTN